jgi:hypothetical protein
MPPDVIAERSYYLEENPTSPVILLQLARPDQPENNYPRCLFRVLIDGRIEETEVSGVDSIDCIATALIMAGTKIAGLNEAVYGNKLRWQGSPVDGDIGLPTIENSPLTSEGYAEALRWALKEKSRTQDNADE